MKLNIYPKLLIVLALLIVPNISFGQFGFYSNPFLFFGNSSRYELGYSYVMATGQFTGTIPVYDNSGGYLRDTSVTKNMTAKVGFGVSTGTSIPIYRFGKTSSLAISIHLMINEFIWGSLNQAYNLDGSFTTTTGSTDLTGLTEQYALPIGLDYKFGTDAVASRHTHVGFSMGAGVMPQYNITILESANLSSAAGGAGVNFGVNPYVKAEASFYFRTCFKLRAFFSFGDVPLIDQSKNLASITDGPFKLTGKSNLNLSFAVLPFSYRWGKIKREWWNDYDTRNTYKR